MEFVEVDLLCKGCGETFTFKKVCQNKIDADIVKQNMIKRRRPLCPKCQRKEQEAANMEKAAKLGLPELMGRSEKQIAYAFSLRNRYACKHEGTIRRAQKYLENMDWDKAEAIYAERGFPSAEALVTEAFRQKGMYPAYLCIAETSAQTIIDVLSQKKE